MLDLLEPADRALLERLLIEDVTRQLPGETSNTRTALSPSEIGTLLSTASSLALAESAREHTIAYEISTRALQGPHGHLPGVVTAADLILSRLGNFPGRQLLRKKRITKGKPLIALPHYLVLESSAREIENTIDDAAGNPTQLTDFQHDLFEALTTVQAVSVSAPTSAGKSFILSLSILHRLKRKPTPSIVYIVPTRALIRQVLFRITRDLNRAGLGNIPVRSVPLPLAREMAPDGVVYVLTQERLMSLLHSDSGTPWITTMFIDEAQSIGDESRGVLLHSAIDAVISRFPSVEVYFASPLARNPDYLLRLFNRETAGRHWVEEHSPVSQNLLLVSGVPRRPDHVKYELRFGSTSISLGEAKLSFKFNAGVFERRARFAMSVTNPGDSTIVYADNPSDTEEIAKILATEEPELNHVDNDISDFIDFLAEHIHQDYDLIKTLGRRVAFHYGFMPAIVRSRVEDLFEAGKLKYICCTSTLLHGVNLPARHVVIERPNKGNGKPMPRADFLNLAGRAGRLLKEFQGNVWCLQPESWKVRSFEGDPLQSISSAFEQTLADGGTLIRQVLAQEAPPEKRELGEVGLGKVFSEYIQPGVLLEQSKYRTEQNHDSLLETASLCAALPVTLPNEVVRRNATILPIRLQNLYVHLRAHHDIAGFMPLMPHEPGSNERMKRIFQIVEEYLGETKNESYKFHAWLASKWIHDVPLKLIIDDRIQLLKTREKFKTVGDTIRELMRAIESELRHRYVKHTKAYNDILGQVLRDTGRGEQADRLKPLHLFLECGASHPVALSLISLGLSRTTALLLKRKIRFPEDASPEQCKAIIAKSAPDQLAMPALCKEEIKKMLYG